VFSLEGTVFGNKLGYDRVSYSWRSAMKMAATPKILVISGILYAFEILMRTRYRQ